MVVFDPPHLSTIVEIILVLQTADLLARGLSIYNSRNYISLTDKLVLFACFIDLQ